MDISTPTRAELEKYDRSVLIDALEGAFVLLSFIPQMECPHCGKRLDEAKTKKG